MIDSRIGIAAGVLLSLLSCQSKPSSEIKDALTFYASFDEGATADFAKGDANIYTATASYVSSSRVLEDVQVGMNNPDYRIIEGEGLFGNAFEFAKTDSKVVFYESKDNVAYDQQNWSGTISFWLRVDPSTELDGYTDPIQITDTNFNDASIWVDFTDTPPRDFRLGVIGDKVAWTQDTLTAPVREVFDRRITSVKASQFSRSSWTHVLISHKDLGSANSESHLYLNGKKAGSVSGVDDPFTWNIDQSKIFLGLNFRGLMDELSIFNQSFNDKQVKELYELKEGIRSIL